VIDERTPYLLVRTSWACPAQWQGQNAAGEWVYLRMRGGKVQIGFGATIEEAIDKTIKARGYRADIDDDVDFEWEDMQPHYARALAMEEAGARYG
jgi:hypothetical protein